MTSLAVPNFNDVKVEEIELPYSSSDKFLRLSFNDPILSNYSLIVVKDTHNDEGSRISSFIARYPRTIHAEFLRHRLLSRNAASSRARSVKSTIRDVMEEPVIPIFTINQKGMGGKYPTWEHREKLVKQYLIARDRNVVSVLESLISPEISEGREISEVARDFEQLLDDYYENGYDSTGTPKEGYLSSHKQQVNRLLEPHIIFEEVITGTYWDNFINLRDHDEAQPEIRAIAVLIREALNYSVPEENWIHLPFIDSVKVPEKVTSYKELYDLLLVSSSEAAQISYHDKSRQVNATASVNLGKRLLESKHYSPFEHPAIDLNVFNSFDDIEEFKKEYAGEDLSGNFDKSWVQFRQVLAPSRNFLI